MEQSKGLTIRLSIAVIALILIYIGAVFVLPGMRIWSFPRTYYSNGQNRIEISEGQVYEQSFEMLYSRICEIGIVLDPSEAKNVTRINGTLELIDESGNTVVSKEVTSAYDSSVSFSYKEVTRGSICRLRFTVNDIGEDSIVPSLVTDDEGNISFTIKGLTGSSDNKAAFGLVYLTVAVATVLYVLNYDRKKIGDSDLCDRLILGVVIALSVLIVSQQFDLLMTSNMAIRLKDSLMSGHITRFVEDSYLAELQRQSPLSLFTYNYDFTFVVVVAVLLLPFMPFVSVDNRSEAQADLIVLYLTLAALALILVSVWLIRFITEECQMSDRYLINVRSLYLTSSVLLFVSLAFGQLDIIYVIVMLIALPFYYRKKYAVFSLIMSLAVAMKTLPLMVFIPLILLANKRIIDIVKNLVLVMIVPLITKVLFERGWAYSAVAGITNKEYSFADRLTETGIGTISLFILSFTVICIAAYFYKADTDDKRGMLYRSMLTIFTVYASFTAFIDWHQQWLIPLVLSLSFLIPFHKDNDRLILMSIILEALIVLLSNTKGSSTYMLNFGLLQMITGENFGGASVKTILNSISPIAIPCVATAIAGVAGFLAWYFIKHGKDGDYNTYECPRPWVIGRLGVISVFILFYAWCFSYIG